MFLRLPLMNRLLHVVLLDESSPSVYLAYEKPATECAMADGLKPFDAWTPERTSKIRRPLFNPRIMDHVGCKHFKVRKRPPVAKLSPTLT